MKLGTHKERMEALEAAFDNAGNGMEQVAIVDVAARLDRENQYVERDSTGAVFAEIPQRQTN